MIKILSGLLVAIVLTGSVQAVTFNVTRMDDPVPDGCDVNNCSLREAVIAADQTVAKDTIVLPAGVYLIDLVGNDSSETVGDLDISSDMEFVGAPSTIDGQDLSRIMDIRSDANVILRDLTLQNANYSSNGGALQIADGSLTLDSVTFKDNSGGALGGAIYTTGDPIVNVEDCLFDNNSAGSGSAMYASFGITVRNTVFQGNNASNRGTLYLAGTTSDSLLENVTFDQNLANGSAGGILFLGRNLSIDGMIATGNESTGANGGALFVSGTAHAKQVEIVNAVFDGNMATDGGAIYFASAGDPLDIRHSSFVGNVASDDGGALYLTGGVLDVTNDTFSGNQATGDGGAIYMFGNTIFTMQHATLSGDSADRGSALYINLTLNVPSAELANNLIDGDCYLSDVGDMTSLGGNVEGTGDSCSLDAGSDLVGQSIAQLGLQPLTANAGGTPTHELTTASVARGQGVPAICAVVQVDQLYEVRGSMCNSGADESNTIFKDGFESGTINP
ncbi:MAG: hypothetical protein WBM36_02655 [Lysobacterales bacterium]